MGSHPGGPGHAWEVRLWSLCKTHGSEQGQVQGAVPGTSTVWVEDGLPLALGTRT